MKFSAKLLPSLPHWPIAPILAVAALLRLWQLSQNGYGRQYYAASVLGMMDSWHNFFFNSFDPAGFVSLDKPPVAIWLQFLSAKLVGFNAFAILLPQVLLGLAAILLVYMLVQRAFGRGAAAVAALLLAITPASVAVDRSNNTESCLIVVLLLAVWAATRAAETTRVGFLLLSMALVGVGFNVKMGAAVAIVPVLVLVHFLADRARSWPRWAGQSAIAGLVLIVTSLAWVSVYDLTPSDKRPYVGSTVHNSMRELTLLHNGAARFIRPFQRSAEAPIPGSESAIVTTAPAEDGAEPPRLWDTSPTGPLRLLRPHQAGQIAWWLPIVLTGAFLGWRRRTDGEATRVRRIAVGIWAGWAATYWLLFSFAGGPFHTYYLAVLAPPLAALAGIGAAELWRRWRMRERTRLLPPAALLATGAWQSFIVAAQLQSGAPSWIAMLWIVSAALLAAGGLAMAVAAWKDASPRWMPAAAAIGCTSAVATLAMPLVSALSVVLIRPNVAAPAANLAEFSRPSDRSPQALRRAAMGRDKLIGFLKSQRGDERFLVAVPNAIIAAPLILSTRAPVMAMGGYAGMDPILTPEELARRAEAGQVRFVMLGGFTFSRSAEVKQQAIGDWVRTNGRPVDPALWSLYWRRRSDTYRVQLGGQWVTMATPQLYDLKK